MVYGSSEPVTRRDFLKKVGYGVLGLSLGGLAVRKSRADEKVTDPEILDKMSALYRLLKSEGERFQLEREMYVNNDGIPDKVKFILEEGSVREGTEVTFGKKFTVEFEVSGKWPGKVYGIVSGDEIRKIKRRWIKDNELKEYLDRVISELEKPPTPF